MNLKAIIQKIAAWVGSEAASVETEARTYLSGFEQRAEPIEAAFKADVLKVESFAGQYTISAELAQRLLGPNMSTLATAPAATTGNNVNTAVQLALALKAIDPSLSVEAVQAATNAALTAAYPVAAAA